MLHMYAVEQLPDQVRLTRLDRVRRVIFADATEKVIQVLARKVEEKPIIWPIQTKYARNPKLSA